MIHIFLQWWKGEVLPPPDSRISYQSEVWFMLEFQVVLELQITWSMLAKMRWNGMYLSFCKNSLGCLFPMLHPYKIAKYKKFFWNDKSILIRNFSLFGHLPLVYTNFGIPTFDICFSYPHCFFLTGVIKIPSNLIN